MDTQTDNQAAATDPNAVPVAGNTTVTDKPGWKLERLRFDTGEAEGFEFVVIEYKSLEAARNQFGQGDQSKGDEAILRLINSQLRFALRNKAKSKLPDDENDAERIAKIDALKAKGETLLLSDTDVENYVPGTREKTSPQTILKELLAAKKAGNMELAAELLKAYKEKMAEIEADILKSVGA